MKTLFSVNHSHDNENRTEAIDTILRFAYALDSKNWSLLRDCLTEQIDTDYTALRGESRHISSRDDFIEKRIKDIGKLRTQHIITNQLATLHTDHAECTSCFLIHRVDPACEEGDNTFDTAGHYLHGLVQTNHGWRIERIHQTVLWNRGNREIHGALRRH